MRTPRSTSGGRGSNQYRTRPVSVVPPNNAGAVRAATVGPSTKEAADRIRGVLHDGLFSRQFPPEYADRSHRVTVTSKRSSRTVTVTWWGTPPESDVAAVVDPVAADESVDVIYHRHPMWSCGHFHHDELDAWKAHEGVNYAAPVGGCDTCGHGSDWEVPQDVIDELEAADAVHTVHHPGNFVACPRCGGHGGTFTSGRYERCADCDERGVFDLDDQTQTDRYQTALAAAVTAAWHHHRAGTGTT